MKPAREHWTKGYQREIDALKREIQDLHDQKYTRAFAEEMIESIGLILANMPYERWPDICKQAFQHTAHKQETSAYLYKRMLPKE
jgi:hypothetical protein